jgi:hypothetical protein
MSGKEHSPSSDKINSQSLPPNLATGNRRLPARQSSHPSTLIQRAEFDPNSLTPGDVLQLQSAIGNRAVGRLLTGAMQRQAIQREENSAGLPDTLKTGIENLSGVSMDDVSVHYNSSRPAQLQALAHTQGTEIHVAPGQEKHLAHEAWHVVQQKHGRVKPTMQMKGVSISDDDLLEREADVMGARAGGGQASEVSSHRLAAESSTAHRSSKSGHENPLPRGGAPLQRKMKIATTGEEFDSVQSATAKVTDDCTPLASPLTSAEQYTVKTANDMGELARGNVTDVLLPHKHIIGEIHTASQFRRIIGEWPGVAAMGEGAYTVKETGLALPTKRGKGHLSFEKSMQAIGSTYLPVENFHAAAYAKLIDYLTMWNEYEHNLNFKDKPVIKSFSRRTPDIIHLLDDYLNVSAGAFIRASDDQKLWHIFPNFKGKIEKAYGKMFLLLNTGKAQDVKTHLEQINAEVSLGNDIPAISKSQFTALRNLIKDLIPAIGNILKVSMAGQTDATTVATEADAISTYVKTNLSTLRRNDILTALTQMNPTRERFMKEQIATLPKPALVKVGRAHLAGLTAIPDTELHNDATDFDAALRKQATDL